MYPEINKENSRPRSNAEECTGKCKRLGCQPVERRPTKYLRHDPVFPKRIAKTKDQ
jgi:SUMO ligase MMS21 Smc5/6 complex component